MRWLTGALVVSLAAMTGGCDSVDETTQLPNPAAVHCEEQGGTVTGPEPLCTLPDGTVVDAWEYYRESSPEQ